MSDSRSHKEVQTDTFQVRMDSPTVPDHCIACAAGIAPSSSHCQFTCDFSRSKASAILKAHGKLLETTRNRERKRFNQAMLRCSAQFAKSSLPWDSLHFSIQWALDASDVKTILNYWHHQSALQSAGLSALLSEKMYSRKRPQVGLSRERSTKLSLTIWNLRGLMHAHMERYPAVQTARGLYYPPLVITTADVVPLTASELTVVHRKSCTKLASFCVKTMECAIGQYREAMTSRPSDEPAEPKTVQKPAAA